MCLSKHSTSLVIPLAHGRRSTHLYGCLWRLEVGNRISFSIPLHLVFGVRGLSLNLEPTGCLDWFASKSPELPRFQPSVLGLEEHNTMPGLLQKCRDSEQQALYLQNLPSLTHFFFNQCLSLGFYSVKAVCNFPSVGGRELGFGVKLTECCLQSPFSLW